MRTLLARTVGGPGDRTSRTMVLTSLVDWFGTGLWITVSVLYFSRVVGLSSGHIGAGMTVGGVLGFIAVIPVTSLVRRYPARNVAATLHALRAAAFVSYLLVDSVTGFFVVVSLVAIVDRPSASVNQLLVAETVPADDRTTTMARLHVATNVGISAGALVGGMALAFESSFAYRALITADAATFLAAAFLIARLPVTVRTGPDASAHRPRHPLRTALADHRFAAVAAANGILALHIPLLNVVAPLWLSERTGAPVALMGGLLLLNTVLVVTMQVRLARRATELPDAARLAAVAGLALAGACMCLILAGEAPAVAAVLLLGGGVALLTLGEMGQGASGWALSFALAPDDDRRTSYLGLFGLGPAAATVFGPALLTFAVFRSGVVGWLMVMAVLATAGLLVPTIIAGRRSEKRFDAIVVEPA